MAFEETFYSPIQNDTFYMSNAIPQEINQLA